MNQDKITQSKQLIYRYGEKLIDSALMCSFGKDSMVLLHLIRETLPLNKLATGGCPIPIIYHKHPWFPFKHEFANEVIKLFSLEVYDYPPSACGVKAKEDRIELVAQYPFGIDGTGGMNIPVNTEEPIPRRSFACGLQWILRPKALMTFPWKTVFIGHKSSDVDIYEGPVPLNSDTAVIGGTTLVFPLRHWTDKDIWDYTDENYIQYDKSRYENRAELEDKWGNSDYIHACMNCVDPRNSEPMVFCPKLGHNVENVGNRVNRIESIPGYILQEVN